MARISARLYERLATLVRSGVPLRQASGILEDTRVGAALGEGKGVADALAAAEAPPFEVAWVRAFELAGRTAEGLDGLAGTIRARRRRLGRLLGYLGYPLLLLHLAALLPAAVEAAKGKPFGALLWTRLLPIDGSIAGLCLLIAASGRPALRTLRDRLLLAIPLVREARMRALVGRIARLLGTAFGAGADLRQAAALAADGVDDRLYALRLADVRRRLHEGETLAGALASVGGFRREVVEWIRAAETAGDVEGVLLRLADENEEEARRRTERLAKLAGGVAYAAAIAYAAHTIVAAWMGAYRLLGGRGGG